MRPRRQATAPAGPSSAVAFNPLPSSKTSPIIDRPGDPVIIRRVAASAAKDALLGVPAKLGEEPKALAKAYFISAPLVSTTGGYMGKFRDEGSTADTLALQLAVNSQDLADPTQATIDAGTDDDGGAETPADAQAIVLTSANSNQLEVNPPASRGQPLLRDMVLKTPVAEKISALLIANGYSEDSARSIESAAKQSSKRIETLPPQSVVLAVGSLDATGDYRAKQIVIFEDGEYVVTIAAKDDGGYAEAAEPLIPPGLLEDSGGVVDAAIHYTLADGVYSAGLRNGAPEAVVREAIQLIQRLLDLSSPLQADETIRLLFETDPRDKARSMGRVVYVGLRGAAASVDCYSFEGSDGFFRCFDPQAGSEFKRWRVDRQISAIFGFRQQWRSERRWDSRANSGRAGDFPFWNAISPDSPYPAFTCRPRLWRAGWLPGSRGGGRHGRICGPRLWLREPCPNQTYRL